MGKLGCTRRGVSFAYLQKFNAFQEKNLEALLGVPLKPIVVSYHAVVVFRNIILCRRESKESKSHGTRKRNNFEPMSCLKVLV